MDFVAANPNAAGAVSGGTALEDAQGFSFVCHMHPHPFNLQNVVRGDILGSTVSVVLLDAEWQLKLVSINDIGAQFFFFIYYRGLKNKLHLKCSASFVDNPSAIFSSGKFEAFQTGSHLLRSTNSENVAWNADGKVLMRVTLEVCDFEMVVEQHRSMRDRSVAADVKRLLGDESTADVKIVAGAESFFVHKFILAACSDVFKAMFQNDMQETRTNEVCITDFKASVIRAMLEVMYTDDCNKDTIAAHADQLLEAAFKYQVPRLKRHCERYYASTLSVENCEELQWMARQRGLSDLRRAALYFIAANKDAVAARIDASTDFPHTAIDRDGRDGADAVT